MSHGKEKHDDNDVCIGCFRLGEEQGRAAGERAGLERAAEIAENQQWWDLAGGSTGNAAGTAINICNALRAETDKK